MLIETIDAGQYLTEREICDKAEQYAESVMCEGGTKRRRNYLTAEEAAAPVYAACNNEMRGRVEQYEILRDKPARLVAYMSQSREQRESTNYESCRGWTVSVWTGRPIGTARITAKWRVNSWLGTHMYQFRARIGGREYTGRGFGDGMSIMLRETAASKRARQAQQKG